MNRLFAAILALALTNCATVAPGQDPIIVKAEQTLAGADVFYEATMAWYFTPGVAETLGRDAIVALELLRTGYDKPYKGVQAALNVYKVAVGSGDAVAAKAALRAREGELAAVLAPAQGFAPEVKK